MHHPCEHAPSVTDFQMHRRQYEGILFWWGAIPTRYLQSGRCRGQTCVHNVDNSLATYLKDRRRRLDPVELGFSSARRRTPGLRREEVAQRANVSVTWYTWLEQGRGGSPSAEVVDRTAQALVLTEVEREHLFLLALGRSPISRQHTLRHVSSRLQRVLDRLDSSPAYIKTAIWDVVA
jgi:transcriptional regulator with XRE-family HTH domain